MAVQLIGSFRPPAWDTEADVLGKPGLAHVRDRTMYLTAALFATMNEAWGGFATAVKTATDVETGEVMMVKADPKDPNAVPLRLTGTQNAAEFSFHRPLTKLNLRVPENRQFIIAPQIRTVEGLGPVVVFPVSKRSSVPRLRRGANIPAEADPEVMPNPGGEPINQIAAAADPAPAGELSEPQ